MYAFVRVCIFLVLMCALALPALGCNCRLDCPSYGGGGGGGGGWYDNQGYGSGGNFPGNGYYSGYSKYPWGKFKKDD